jgi:hypothetical protein
MYESEEDVRRLQEMLDRTLPRANPHLASIVSPKRRLTARQAVNEPGEPAGGAAEGGVGVHELEIYGSSPFTWGEGVAFMVVEPSSMWAYAFHLEEFPE